MYRCFTGWTKSCESDNKQLENTLKKKLILGLSRGKGFFYTGTYVLTVDSKYGLWYVKPDPLLQTLDT